jgi:hypothetical protein
MQIDALGAKTHAQAFKTRAGETLHIKPFPQPHKTGKTAIQQPAGAGKGQPKTEAHEKGWQRVPGIGRPAPTLGGPIGRAGRSHRLWQKLAGFRLTRAITTVPAT